MTLPNTSDASSIIFDARGLVPVVVQDADTECVLMLAYMDAEALEATRHSGQAHYWSRSRGRLWRKGESSGHTQRVVDLHVNCERNSLLLRVHQRGAVCHDGYPSCYYRRLNPDNSLTVDQERVFDPDEIYGYAGDSDSALSSQAQTQFAAYLYLKEYDFSEVSATSRRLRPGAALVSARLADELCELAGVVDGTHAHDRRQEDLRLETGQVIYWAILLALQVGATWDQLRPDVALRQETSDVSLPLLATLLRNDAALWASESPLGDAQRVAARLHATLSLAVQACAIEGVSIGAVIEEDLASLRQQPALNGFWTSQGDNGQVNAKT